MPAARSLAVSYAQIAVFQSCEPQPFNAWTDLHVNQGFAWRPGAVSFRTKAEGEHEVEIAFLSPADVSAEGLRVIEVPFAVRGPDPVIVASVGDEFEVQLPEGSYALRFAIAADDPRRIHLGFLKNDKPEFRILRQDADLMPSEPLVTEAEPA